MSGTFTQIYIHIVFSPKSRQCLIHPSWEDRLYKYITGIVQNKGQKMLAIDGMPDHIHFLIGMKPDCNLSDLVREVKKSSNAYIKDNRLSQFQFNWQKGYGAFSYSHSQLTTVIRYIMRQKGHHRRRTFKDEYMDILRKFNVEFEERFLFDWVD